MSGLTFLPIVASLLSPTEGTILFEGQDIASLSPESYRQQVSYCVQTPVLFGDTVFDNLIFPWQIRNKTPEPEKFIDDLARFGLAKETLTKSISELSGGEKQRVSLIRNLQFLPKVLLLDEITSALDDTNKRNVNEIIHRYAREQNIAVLWVTHDSNEITHADDVITLQPHGGKMQEANRGYREKLGLEKDIVWSICRAVVQLVIVGYVLKYIFNVNHAVLTLLMVLFICFNAAWNAQKRSKYIDKAFISSFIAITTGTALTLAVLVLSGSIEFTPMQVIPISGMIAGNAMVAVGLCYNNLGQRFSSEQQQLQEKLSLGATPKVASARLIRESIRSSLIPTVDSAKTVGLVSLPGMMSGLIFAGIDPVKAIKYQIMVTFMLLSTASLSTIIACYLTYRKFYNPRHQLVVTPLKKTG
ncbi:hypothetical protein ID866_903 [Astraeus odoratus]|nr:hypothetical protein ID866_903 [Astraeus odoratus]